ncbi:sodium/proline symporter [Sphingosinicella rhizophila]|uniref:Sodium/proline symporter n=1 Tax=Sphingosinicella rhizophila TaxID=3050082 RepID=A0ABU3Q6Q0_9SPHN|nr:sodium/proline symporter [Sphingosinicella sp. GR2756]MDT9599091.1 sodium/proline symporter [Sphingosinicella sp. GR2756]
MITILSFGGLLILYLGIGFAASMKGRETPDDYHLASRSVPPSLVGLSAIATNNSAFMFIGVIGYTYVAGLAAAWLLCGWIFGDFLGSLLIHQKLRKATERTGERSFGGVISRWNGADMPTWRRLAAIVTIVSLGTYTAAQIVASGKAFQGALGWERSSGIWMLAPILLLYGAFGGIRASMWRDVAQAAVMLASIGMMFFAGLSAAGGISETIAAWRAIPGFLDLTPPALIISGAGGLILFALGWILAGLSVIGQPHVMVRFMALGRPQQMMAARIYYYSYFIIFYLLATGVGMLARLHAPGLADAELALPVMAASLLPPALLGIVLSGIFAAAMSTADSLVMNCSTALAYDVPPDRLQHPLALKAGTMIIVAAALVLALQTDAAIFDLVIFSWSALGAAFGPLLILLAGGRSVSQTSAILITATGVAVALAWRGAGFHDMVYEGLPAIAAGLALGLALSSGKQRRFVSG